MSIDPNLIDELTRQENKQTNERLEVEVKTGSVSANVTAPLSRQLRSKKVLPIIKVLLQCTVIQSTEYTSTYFYYLLRTPILLLCTAVLWYCGTSTVYCSTPTV